MSDEQKVRIDKWLWAARFFKTRSMAANAVTGGKVHLNGARVKPSRSINIGDRLRIQKGIYEFIVEVVGISARRGPAKEARLLYEETEESMHVRERVREESRFAAADRFGPLNRPGKRDRRLIKKFIRKGQ